MNRRVAVLAVVLGAMSLMMGQGCPGPDLNVIPQGDDDFWMPMTLESDFIDDGGTLADYYSYEGGDSSPPLYWTQVPEGTKTLAITMTDADEPGFSHWSIYNLPVGMTDLPSSAGNGEWLGGVLQGPNSRDGENFYTGPDLAPGDTHHYVFTLYALDEEIHTVGLNAFALQSAVQGHVLATATLHATYTGHD